MLALAALTACEGDTYVAVGGNAGATAGGAGAPAGAAGSTAGGASSGGAAAGRAGSTAGRAGDGGGGGVPPGGAAGAGGGGSGGEGGANGGSGNAGAAGKAGAAAGAGTAGIAGAGGQAGSGAGGGGNGGDSGAGGAAPESRIHGMPCSAASTSGPNACGQQCFCDGDQWTCVAARGDSCVESVGAVCDSTTGRCVCRDSFTYCPSADGEGICEEPCQADDDLYYACKKPNGDITTCACLETWTCVL